VNIYDINSPELELKSGGFYNIEYYGNSARGESLLDRIKDEFSNQATVKFKYWGFRMINVKLFMNGRLQMTGLKYEKECEEIAALIINILKNIKINVNKSIENIIMPAGNNVDASGNIQVPGQQATQILAPGQQAPGQQATQIQAPVQQATQIQVQQIPVQNKVENDFELVYDSASKKVYYYRKKYDRYLKHYNFDVNSIYDKIITDNNTGISSSSEYHFTLQSKTYTPEIHNNYVDNLVDNNEELKKKLNDAEWYSDKDILMIIDKIELIKLLFDSDYNICMTSSKDIKSLKINIETLYKKYLDFQHITIDKILRDISDDIYNNDEQSLMELKDKINVYCKEVYKNILKKKVNRLIEIRNIDVLICYTLNKYFTSFNTSIQSHNSQNNTQNKNSN